MSELTNLPNIVKDTEKLLIQVGIETYYDLVSIGSRDALLKIKEIDPSACINRLLDRCNTR